MTEAPRFRCPHCGRVPVHPADVANRYCPCCGNPPLLSKDCDHTRPRPTCGAWFDPLPPTRQVARCTRPPGHDGPHAVLGHRWAPVSLGGGQPDPPPEPGS